MKYCYRGTIIDTEVTSLGIEGKTLTPELKDQLRIQELDPDITDFHGGEFARIFMDDRTNELIIHEFMKDCYRSMDNKPCKTIFFCASQDHADHVKRIFNRLYPGYGNEVQVITSRMARAQDEILRFKNESEPRIALSVGMLDTGIDVPEVCNLVFAKPVYTPSRFWQMIGRGTRNESSCKHKEWLPMGTKKDFLIMDFKIGGHSNIQFHELEEAKERNPSRDPLTMIFENRVELLKKELTGEQENIIVEKIMGSIEELDRESFIVRERTSLIEKLKANRFDVKKYVRDLISDIAPLMITRTGSNSYVITFILHAEKLFGYILCDDREGIAAVRKKLQKMIVNVLRKDSLEVIRENRENLTRTLREDMWDDLTFDDVEFLVRRVAWLMRFYEPGSGILVQIDKPDAIIRKEEFVKEIREDPKLKEFIETNMLMQKIRSGAGLRSRELFELAEELRELKPDLTIEYVQKYQDRDFIEFLWEIIGMEKKGDPREIIEERFNEFIISKGSYNSIQLEFLELLKKIFSDRKYIEQSDFGRSPLADEHPLDIFSYDELRNLIAEINEIAVC